MGDFKLQLEPADKIIFSGKKLGEEPTPATIKITNTLKERVAYKVKCTSNEMFRIRPPVGALKADDNVTVSLTFNAGKTVPDSGKHYFAVYYIKAPDEKKAPRATWADHKGDPEGTKRLYIDFKKEGEEEKKDEKKDEEKKDEKKEEKKDEEKKDEKKEEKKDEEKKDEKKEEKKDEEKKDEKKDEEKKEEKK
ncbi:unnamed protein product [Nippostrongylus brasiliensis]|uniref:Major sperm protein n=1 Tax=Nippostrongylus brasiliensis TaxID=27835 RepID=A0A0N4Y0C2_NIPBR|nr:hypothetical protein Q1695_012857 [Nippostrongylus brasiliensis]VDL72554.1 unnamed protein product [Nippostrongylus brasiliensis]